MKYAQIVNGIAVDVIDGAPDGRFHSQIAARFVAVGDQVVAGWQVDANGVWSAPSEPSVEVPAPESVTVRNTLTRLEFLRRFVLEERVAMRAAAQTDPVVADWWELLQLAQEVSVDDADTVAALAYLESQGILAAGRADAILAM